MVAKKLDPTVDRILFLPYLSNGDEYGKKDHGNEFRGSKNGEKEVWVGLKWPENTKIRRPKLATAAAFAGPIWACPTAVGREILLPRLSGGGAPPCPARVHYWWPESAPMVETRSV